MLVNITAVAMMTYVSIERIFWHCNRCAYWQT